MRIPKLDEKVFQARLDKIITRLEENTERMRKNENRDQGDTTEDRLEPEE